MAFSAWLVHRRSISVKGVSQVFLLEAVGPDLQRSSACARREERSLIFCSHIALL